MISKTAPIYPNGRGHYALGHPDGEVLYPGQNIEIVFAGFQIAGMVQKSDLGDYFLLHSGDRCGLCARMRVVLCAQGCTRQLSVEGIDLSAGIVGRPDLRCIALVENGKVMLLQEEESHVSVARRHVSGNSPGR